MRISYVTETYPPEINGVSLTVQRTVDYLRQQGHRLDLIRPRQRGEATGSPNDECLTAGMPIPMYPDLRLGLSTPRALRERFRKTRPDLVHVVTQGPLGYAAARAALQLGIPLTTDFRTNFHFYSRYYRLGWLQSFICAYLRRFHNQAQQTFVPSREMQRALACEGFERLEIVGRGVDSERFSPLRRSPTLRASWGAGDAQRVLLYVGRLAREKNVGLALRAFMAARQSHPELLMVVIGDGPLRQELEAAYPEVHFAGVQHGDALACHYASADLFVFPSLSETFGNVTLEALASGLAVVAFDTAAASDYIIDGDNGFTVPLNGDDAFIAKVSTCLTMPAMDLAALRVRARASIRHAHWDKILGAFENHLLRAAAAPARASQPHVALA